MGSGTLLEGLSEPVAPVETQIPPSSIAAYDPIGLDNNGSAGQAEQEPGLMVEPEASVSTSNMLKLMEESNREAASAIATQKPALSQELPPTVPSLEDRVTDLSRESLAVSSSKLVGLLVPLSGRGSILGEAMLNAAQMALFENFDHETQLIIGDTEGTPEGADAAARFVISAGAGVIVGPLFNTSVRAVAPLVSSASVPMIVFSNDTTVAGDGIHVFGFTPEQEVGRIVSFATREGKPCKVAMVPDSAYGQAVSRAFVERGGQTEPRKVVATFSADGSDIAAVVKELATEYATGGASAPLDCIFIASGGDQLRAIATRLPYYDVNMASVQLLGTALWRSEGMGEEPALRGGWFAAPTSGHSREFNQRYLRAFGSAPPFRAALAYDAVSLIGKLLAGAPGTHGINDLLLDDGGFQGIQGIFRFTESGRTDRPLAVYEVTRKGFKVIDPAIQHFRP